MYTCKSCWYASAVKLWKCPDCQAFGAFVMQEESMTGTSRKQGKMGTALSSETENTPSASFSFQDARYERVFTWWLHVWSIYLLWWEPGIGKSTLVLHIVQQSNLDAVAYFSGEEQIQQVSARYERLFKKHPDFGMFHTTSLEDVIATLQEWEYNVCVIDSIQTIASQACDGIAWSPSQVKFCADALIHYCRKHHITLLCLWHVTKWWEIAGPKYLEHIVDVVLYIEWDRYGSYRVLRCSKNRFGGTDDAIVFAMTPQWLEIVGNDFRLHGDTQWQQGRVLTVWLENGRPILVHVEALLTKNYTNHPQRNALGIDSKRLTLIIAILEKYCHCKLRTYDIFVNIPWEFLFYDSGIDMAIAAAIYSQYKNTVPDTNLVYLWEIGLSGQVVKPKLYEKRIKSIPESMLVMETIGKRIETILQD